MENEVAIIEIMKEPMALGEVFAKSGMFPDIKTQSQAVVKILAGKELGMSPFEAMASIYIVNGKLALSSKAMAAKVKNSKKYDYKLEKLTDEECAISFYDNSDKEKSVALGTSIFTFKDAAKAGLVNKDSWKNYPRNMLFARALSNGARWFCPDCISGYYSVEELADLGEEVIAPKVTVEVSAEGKVANG